METCNLLVTANEQFELVEERLRAVTVRLSRAKANRHSQHMVDSLNLQRKTIIGVLEMYRCYMRQKHGKLEEIQRVKDIYLLE